MGGKQTKTVTQEVADLKDSMNKVNETLRDLAQSHNITENQLAVRESNQMTRPEPAQMIPAEQPFSPMVQTGEHETATTLAAATAKASIEARFIVALNRPRSFDAVRVALLKECKRPSFAEVAIYAKPISNTVIKGPSIRFAEAALRCFGNVEIDCMIVFESPEKRKVVVGVTDLESNITYKQEITIQKTVERRQLHKGQQPLATRTNVKGQTLYIVEATEDELLTKTGALQSKAIRTQAQRLLPGDLVEEAQNLCKATIRDRDAQDPDSARKKLVDAFADLNVPVAEISQLLGHDLGSASEKELGYLRQIWSTIRDGEISWSEVMHSAKGEVEKTSNGSKTSDLMDKIKDKAKKTAQGAQKPPESQPKKQGPKAQEPPQAQPQAQQAPEPADSGPSIDHIIGDQDFDAETGEVALGEEPSDEDLGL